MSYKGYEWFYVNGSSHTKGGGFETSDVGGWFSEDMQDYYLKHYNVTWKSCEEVSFASRLSKLLDIKVVNEAIQGGSLDRVIRKTYEFIESHWDERHKYFIILETPDASRLDLYYKPLKQHLIVNDDNNGSLFGTTSYFPKQLGVDDIQDDFKFYAEKFYDLDRHHKDNERKLIGLYSFCKKEKIRLKLMSGFRLHNYYDAYDETDIISGLDSDKFDLISWCIENKKQIKHETNFEIIDGHPGYFAHIEYAQILKDWLDKNLKPCSLETK